MQAKLEEEKKAAKERYEELLAALEVMNKANQSLLFEIRPNETFFEEMYENNKVSPLYVEFVSKNSGAKFTIENKFFPHSWVFKAPQNATKEELDFVRDLTLETIAHPKNAHKDYQPKLLAVFPDGTPEEEIFDFIKAAERKGIEVNLFIGPMSQYEKVSETHNKKTKEVIESGELDELPGWDGFMREFQKSEGGRKGEDMLNKYRSEHTNSLSHN
ncbi:hypothetical protein [Legionella parisiensis]|uniref:Uncharacterized protein n=1 Tax=Legionella parisiensis TaxID=45071 RepID=A0A1E5JTH5_9GAMM|nr:hypothetical protein [Legionella parisiensis]KTD40418.1 hypothetical protein Lpar_1735 [Legionella parisiensis]OEH47827.1 hypothetical protein lpari_01205 [Legionella parisiensis]STX77148.1 Uncharacterised protein [Legionella parisiensis]